MLKAFVGLKIYRRSTMRTDKFDKDEKEKKMNALTGFKKFDTADTKNMTYAEKLERWLGTNYDVDEKDHIITITKTHPSNTPIYDQFDIFIKDKDLVKVTDKEIQFSDAMDIRAGKVIEAHSSKQKLYLGYDEADTDLPKKPINDQVDGDPAAYDTQYDVETTTEVSKDISLDFAPSLTPAEKTAINALTIDKHVAFAEMTDPSPKNKKREAYNTAFGEFVKTTRGTDFALMKQNMDALLNFLSFKPEEKTSFDDLWKKNPETKRAMISALIQA